MSKRSLGAILLVFMLVGTIPAQGSMDQTSMPPQGQEEGQGGPGAGTQKNGPPRVPPQSAIDACASKSEGTACQVSTPQGTRSGICTYTPDKKYFACKPEDRKTTSQGKEEGQGGPGAGTPKNGPPKDPPQSAIDACTSKSEGTACEVSTPQGTKSGICAYTPDKKYFACKPDDIKK